MNKTQFDRPALGMRYSRRTVPWYSFTGAGIVLVIVAALVSRLCGASSGEKSPPSIRSVDVKDDGLLLAMGVNLLRFKIDVSGISVPPGRTLFLRVWGERHAKGKPVVELPERYVQSCGKCEVLQVAYFQEPLFLNDTDGLVVKVSVYDENGGASHRAIRVPYPFKVFSSLRSLGEEVIELDKDYIFLYLGQKYATDIPATTPAIPSDGIPKGESELDHTIVFKARFSIK